MELTLNSKQVNNIVVLYPKGHINAHTVNEFERKLEEIINLKNYNILINCENLDYISSAGLGAIMGVIEEIRENSGDLRMCNMSESVYNIFDIVGFTELYKIFNTEEEALNSFGN
jgi:anti-sigma B factor antagonist